MLQLAILALAGAVGAQHSGGCPESYGLQLYPHESYCDKFYKCANGKKENSEHCTLYIAPSVLMMRKLSNFLPLPAAMQFS